MFVDEIMKFNEDRRLFDREFNLDKEIAMVREELQEAIDAMTDDEVVDAFADAIVILFGSIRKKGYDPSRVMDEVCKHINSESGGFFAEDKGKWIKGIRTYNHNLSGCKICNT
jgi:predicted HAD superfamily Cof-like phosphohydrolase